MRLNILMPIMTFMTRYYHSSQHTRRFNSVYHQIFKIFHLTIFALVVSFIISCEEGPTKIGNEILPGSDFVIIKSIDTLSVRSYTMYDDSVRTDNPTLSYLGQIYDPYFGTTTAGFVTQIRLGGKWDGKPFTIDSVKLFLQLLDVRGPVSDAIHTISLSEIAEQIYTDKPYYSTTKVDTTGYEVTNIKLPVLKPDTINNISITLPPSFGAHLTRDTAILFHSNSKPDFRSFFKGLYFQMDPGTNPLLATLSLVNANSGSYNNIIVLFMDEAGTKKEYYFILDATNRNAAFNKFAHNYSTATLGNKMAHRNDTTYRDTLSYLQYLNGVYTKLVFPGLRSLKSDPSFKNIAVNKARLTIPVYFDGNLYKASTAPPRLRLRFRTKSGSKYEVPDYAIGFDERYPFYFPFFDGSLDTTAKVYHFNIPTYVQRYLNDTINREILPELEVFQPAGTKNVILKANNSKTPVKFEFTYTKF